MEMRLNRTSVGLKQHVKSPFLPHQELPQSNQRGIETRVQGGFGGSGESLNRTSVGLKPLCWAVALSSFRSLNRTSVGLKRIFCLWVICNERRPQSNQRGIETFARIDREIAIYIRLNRTSVGLKLKYFELIRKAGWGLNRTSVGLKPTTLSASSASLTGLNRTSVGLKRETCCGVVVWINWPQSNQRGIETHHPRGVAAPAG